ncbi:alpha/beta hydrolase [Amycolatopsis sp. PS_44_ISF1]|uniref:alpha/beta fold hydrolase n=1 Tax=Amycolatopsis sp. PS_44_ISF1 TaxID=2974917 RepID=UPI0028DE241D|nr:alpha/beta hydrolase [Amycolatopsis sp. PS_44_ISF1]MDT8912965.1 alpha/beta hydrolase [Amycolatopsis sp. PS_44_ISF1]
MPLETFSLTLHGRRVRVREHRPGGHRPDEAVVLLHGIAGCAQTWSPVLRRLEEGGFSHRVLAPDLPGHGGSDSPRADYGLGTTASAVRDLLALSGVRHATVVGHSLGGGIAMQFAYQFPHLCDRLMLVSSGGLGREVGFALRAATLPGAGAFLTLTVNRGTLALSRALARTARALGGRLSPESRELARHLGSLADPGRRRAFLAITRGLLDLRGQRGSALEKLYLSAGVPIRILWGARDPLIPVAHGRRAAGRFPEIRLTVMENAKHFPHVLDPGRFCGELTEFVEGTEAARVDVHDVAARLLAAGETPGPAEKLS